MLDTLFGHGRDLDALQMTMRASVLFFVALVLVRIAGMRAFGRKSPFDITILVLLGAVISRAVYGASPAIPIVAASLALAVVHRLVAIVASYSPLFERIVRGTGRVLYRDGHADARAMHRAGISLTDLDEAVRRYKHEPNRFAVDEIRIETSGELTVIEAPKAAPRP
jgi:uncharacterized membrane protein YcaP (DUF421 family)